MGGLCSKSVGASMMSSPESDARAARGLRVAEAEFGDYDVFISHRGPDTKSVFAGCLDGALKRAGLSPFLDCKSIDLGQYSWDCIERAIQRTPLAVVVFSNGFAESEWCLRELHAMLACPSVKVIPVFYDVEPWELKYPEKGQLKAGFAKLQERHDQVLIKEWRAALKEASTIRGEVCGVGSKRLVEDVVADVVEKICELANKPLPLHVGGHVLGHQEVAGNLIRTVDEKKVSVLGLWGMGGIGKSTLAQELFNQLHGRFDASCYLGDVTEKVKNGVIGVQRDILKALCGDQSMENVLSESAGKAILEDRLSKKRILVVLDDVSDVNQMGHLISLKMLKEGSLCIVTSRDCRVFQNSTSFPVNAKVHTHVVETLTDQASQAVLASHAFGQDKVVPEEFGVLVGAVSKACGGVPLVLGVIGSRLRGERNVYIWKETLDMLAGGSVMDEGKVLKVLRSSYDSLQKSHQEMFLDVACALLGSSVECAKIVWRSQGWGPALGVRTLVEKALITVDRNGKFHMHDVLRDMGREICKRDSSSMGKRVWNSESWRMLNAREALPKSLETLEIQWRPGRGVDLSSMERLRILKGSGSHVPWSSLPRNLHLLELRETQIERLPTSFGRLRMVRVLDLGRSSQLKDLPNSFGGLENLEYLDLEGCPIERLPESFGYLRKLEVLILHHCLMLRVLPVSFGDLEDLKQLDLSYSNIESLPDSFGRLHNLKCLNLSGTRNQSIPEYIGALSNLEELDLRCCDIRSVPEFIGRLYKLKRLILGRMDIQSIPECIGSLSNLETLNVSACFGLTKLPEIFGGLQNLRVLDVHETSIRSLPESIGTLSNLNILDIHYCKQFVGLPDCFQGLQNLRKLNLRSTKIRSLPESIGTLINVETLDLSRSFELVELPDCFGGLRNLRNLDLACCRKIQRLPESIGSLSNLETLHVHDCYELVELPDCFGGLKNLRVLDLSRTKIQSLPQFVGTLSNLVKLKVHWCEHLLELGDIFGGLGKLKHLDLSVTRIRSLPESFGALVNLDSLNVSNCYELVELPNSICCLPSEIQLELHKRIHWNVSTVSTN